MGKITKISEGLYLAEITSGWYSDRALFAKNFTTYKAARKWLRDCGYGVRSEIEGRNRG
jgi:hypothetical protein